MKNNNCFYLSRATSFSKSAFATINSLILCLSMTGMVDWEGTGDDDSASALS